MKNINAVHACFLLISLTGFSQDNNGIQEKFFRLLNDYKKDSLEILVTDNFMITRTFSEYKNDKTSFLDFYLPAIKELNAKFYIIQKKNNQFLVKDYTNLLHYLKIDTPTWKITFTVTDNKIEKMVIDSTGSYKKYAAELKKKEDAFDAWWENKYPGERESFNATRQEGLYTQRSKEYAEKK